MLSGMRVNVHIQRRGLVMMAAIILAGAGVARAVDWTQYRGPTHDGVSTEKIQKSWPASGPHAIWKVPMTAGFSSLAVGGGKVFSLVAREVDSANQEVCVAFDAASGKE